MNKSDFVTDKRGNHIPRGIARYAAERDAYLRDSIVKCVHCGTAYTLGDSDSPDVCQSCYDEAGEENARNDA